jgi:dolichol-phosphate mannosyltransferase
MENKNMALVNLNVVVSVYNEEAALPLFYKELYNELVQLNISYQIIFVNDGSHDNSYEILKTFARENSRVKVINFSRNFGHEAAMLAGLDYSNAEAKLFKTDV